MTAPARCDAVVVDLGPGPSAGELLCRAADRPGLVAFVGSWADGSAVLSSHPVIEAGDATALARQPAVHGAPAGFLGGGWFGRLAFDGPSRLAFHDHVVRRQDGRWRFEALVSAGREDEIDRRAEEWRALLAAETPPSSWVMGNVDGPSADEHLAAVEAGIELVRAGELYQVNVCTRLHASFDGSAAGLFAAAVAELAPSYSAFLGGDPAIVSLSPELFLRRRGRAVASSPIKGTLPRTVPGNDRALRRSVKDVAENVMIVDLVRNDLGRVSVIGSVRPSALLDVVPAPGVWHLVSTVDGRLRADVSDADLIAATFPPGSVTGAPKLRAIEAIGAIEPEPRRTFTGAIGFASPVLGAEFAVAIRTFEISDGRVELGVGGGITADSVPAREWQECLDKATPLLRAAGARIASHLRPAPAAGVVGDGAVFETIAVLNGRPVRLADHLARLDRSWRELTGEGVPADVRARVLATAAGVPEGRAAVRVMLRPGGPVEVTASPHTGTAVAADLVCTVRGAGSWRHKWADRSWAEPDTLFVAADGTVLETERGNVFLIEPDGTLVTPPLRDDLLPGVTRRAVLDHARDTGRRTVLRGFGLDEMLRRPAFWTSSLSGAVAIRSVDGVELPSAAETVAALREALFGGERSVR